MIPDHLNPEAQLLHYGVKPTSVRLLVWKRIRSESEAFSLKDVSDWLPTIDRSSIFRALRLFAEHHILHETDDGTGQMKYCLCRCQDGHHHGHVHFTCTQCGRTYCLEDLPIPEVPLPDGFSIHEMEYVIKGVCATCSGD